MNKDVTALGRAELITELKAAREEINEWKRSAAHDCAVQYRALVECDESELSPDALEVRKILLRDRAEYKKAIRQQARLKDELKIAREETLGGGE